MCLDSDDEWSLGSFETFRIRNKKIKFELGNEVFTCLDDCINANYNYQSVRSQMGSHRNNLKDKENTHLDLVPIVFGTIEVIIKSTVDKARRKSTDRTVKILLDSGASASIIRHTYVRKNKLATKNVTNQWTTIAGTFNTNQIVNINLKLPELNSTAEIKVEYHVTKNESNYDIIIGKNLLRELGIILDFANLERNRDPNEASGLQKV